MKRILVPLLVLALLCVGVSASAEGNTIKFDGKVNFVFEGETLQTVLERTGVPAEGELTYTSGNTSVATVDSNGVVTGVSKGSHRKKNLQDAAYAECGPQGGIGGSEHLQAEGIYSGRSRRGRAAEGKGRDRNGR